MIIGTSIFLTESEVDRLDTDFTYFCFIDKSLQAQLQETLNAMPFLGDIEVPNDLPVHVFEGGASMDIEVPDTKTIPKQPAQEPLHKSTGEFPIPPITATESDTYKILSELNAIQDEVYFYQDPLTGKFFAYAKGSYEEGTRVETETLQQLVRYTLRNSWYRKQGEAAICTYYYLHF